MYKFFMGLTQQFRYCGNAFRIDTYKGCDFGCNYCFANSRKGNFSSSFDNADINEIKKNFYKVLETDTEYKNITAELLRKKVPLHFGGMSDPFQDREWDMKLTYQLIEITNKYNYPMMISTKCAELPDEYWDILNPELHAFQISLMGYTDDFIRKYESHTPSVQERINFIKKLKDKGFWVCVRIQPLVDLNEALLLVKNLNDINIDYITVEHLKIPTDNKEIKELFRDLLDGKQYYKPKQGRAYELKTSEKIHNITELKKVSKIPIGVGDNDLHELSESRCCCGIDTIGGNFDSWLKYNYTYFVTGDKEEDIWYPQNTCRNIFNSTDRISKNYKDAVTVADYVDLYCKHFQYSILKDEDGEEK